MRTLVATVLAAALLTGCATDLYSYRAGPGDYYYGRPQTDVRVWGSYSHGYPWHYGLYFHPYYGYYGPYGYRGPYRPYYYWPYDPYWYGYGPPRYRPRPHPHPGPRPDDRGHDRDGSPWRDLDDLRRRRENREIGVRPAMPAAPPRPAPTVTPPPPREPRGGRLEESIRRLERDRRPTLER